MGGSSLRAGGEDVVNVLGGDFDHNWLIRLRCPLSAKLSSCGFMSGEQQKAYSSCMYKVRGSTDLEEQNARASGTFTAESQRGHS